MKCQTNDVQLNRKFPVPDFHLRVVVVGSGGKVTPVDEQLYSTRTSIMSILLKFSRCPMTMPVFKGSMVGRPFEEKASRS